jgi:hypothetical protein
LTTVCGRIEGTLVEIVGLTISVLVSFENRFFSNVFNESEVLVETSVDGFVRKVDDRFEDEVRNRLL